jgi:hypothetical protein
VARSLRRGKEGKGREPVFALVRKEGIEEVEKKCTRKREGRHTGKVSRKKKVVV